MAKGRIAGVHTGSSAMVRTMIGHGFHFASLLTDVRLFANALATSLAQVRATTADAVKRY
jgi:2-keto-3-deoxy-L-rhamnonate aldolase RhmA